MDLSFEVGRVKCIDPDEEEPDTVERLWLRPLKLLFVDVENVGQTPALDLNYGVKAALSSGKQHRHSRFYDLSRAPLRPSSSAARTHERPPC